MRLSSSEQGFVSKRCTISFRRLQPCTCDSSFDKLSLLYGFKGTWTYAFASGVALQCVPSGPGQLGQLGRWCKNPEIPGSY